MTEVVARTGKLTGVTKILIPYFDVDGRRQWTIITIEGTLYASKMYAGIKDFVKRNFNVEVNKDWLIHVPLITNSNDPNFQVTEEEKNALIEEFIQRMELKDEDEDSTDTIPEEGSAQEAELQMRPVPKPSTGEQA